MIKEINVSGFKSLEEETLKTKPLTIITGVNSSGKSTLLQSILLFVMHSSIENKYKMELLLSYLKKFIDIRNKTKKYSEINISINDGSKYGSLNIDFESFTYNGDLLFSYDNTENNNDIPELFYLSANRFGAEDNSLISENQKIGKNWEYLFGYFDKIKNQLIDDDICKFKEAKTIGYQVGRWLSYITKTETELKTENQNSKVKVTFHDEKLGELSPFNLGIGMSYLVKVLITCLIANKNDLVIIENPEIHLHPNSQSLLGEFLAFISSNGIQILIETHCEHLINNIRYQVYSNNISKNDIIIHYKESITNKFSTLNVNENGHYIDSNNNRISFPKGFFDSSLKCLIEMGA